MQIKRAVEKVPGGLMLVPLLLGALCKTFSPERLTRNQFGTIF
jgi:2-keto-3-deoxygluconate permease